MVEIKEGDVLYDKNNKSYFRIIKVKGKNSYDISCPKRSYDDALKTHMIWFGGAWVNRCKKVTSQQE